MQYPATVGIMKQIVSGIQFVWLGNVAESVSDTIVANWSAPSSKCDVNHVPEFSPYSLKYVYLLFCWSVWNIFKIKWISDVEMTFVHDWSPTVPRVFSNRVILYYTRGSQWLYDASSETDWQQAMNHLKDWIKENKGKSPDSFWDVLSVVDADTMDDVTNDLFQFMGPSMNFIHKHHLRRRYSGNLKLETIDGDVIEI